MINKKSSNSFIKYSGLAFQMIGILLVFTWLGKLTDKFFDFKTPWFTIIFILLALTGIMYKLIKDFSSK